jgi:hypothetical protein
VPAAKRSHELVEGGLRDVEQMRSTIDLLGRLAEAQSDAGAAERERAWQARWLAEHLALID